MLLPVTLTLAVAALIGAFVCLFRAPAVSLALLGGLAGGGVGFRWAAADGPKEVPFDTAVPATVALVVLGLVGLVLTRGRPPARALRRSALWVLVATPLAGAALTFALQGACPLYVTRHAGYCFYSADVLGGWVTGVVFLFVVDLLFVAGILYLSSVQAETAADR
jgi:hypothetical protein